MPPAAMPAMTCSRNSRMALGTRPTTLRRPGSLGRHGPGASVLEEVRPQNAVSHRLFGRTSLIPQVRAAHAVVGLELGAGAADGDSAGFQDVRAVGDVQRGNGIL